MVDNPVLDCIVEMISVCPGYIPVLHDCPCIVCLHMASYTWHKGDHLSLKFEHVHVKSTQLYHVCTSLSLLCDLPQSLSSWSPDCLFGLSWDGPLSFAHRVKQTTSSLMELVTTSQPQFALCLSPHPDKTEPNKVMTWL